MPQVTVRAGFNVQLSNGNTHSEGEQITVDDEQYQKIAYQVDGPSPAAPATETKASKAEKKK